MRHRASDLNSPLSTNFPNEVAPISCRFGPPAFWRTRLRIRHPCSRLLTTHAAQGLRSEFTAFNEFSERGGTDKLPVRATRVLANAATHTPSVLQATYNPCGTGPPI